MAYYIVGIVPVGGTVRDEYPLVQSRCHCKVLDVYTIAEVVQDYYSSATLNRNVEYVFPLPPSAAVCSFKAVVDDDKVIKGIVKEKGEAKKEYNEAVAQGKTAGLLQQEHADVFRVSLGNIKPKQKISIHISFVSIIPHDGSSPQSLRITMPTAIAPRYGAAPTNIPWFGKNGGNRFELTVSIQMSKPVASVSSPSHPISLTLGCAEKELTGDYEPSKAFVHLAESTFLDKDIVIVISSQGLDAPRCAVERWLSSEGAEETTDAYALTLVPKFDLPALPSQEYIFLVDRSGSMGGGRMESVKTGLQIMLRSLPSRNTTFNIVSFGSRYTSLWPKSQMYSAETVAEASKHVDTFTASYGGTELRSALQFAFSSRQALAPNSTEKPPAAVFVLTDGEAWDLDGIINLVTENVEAAKRQNSLLRAFVLGVGNQVSTAMCEGIARAGKGSTVFVAEGEKPDAKLMSLLKAARGGVIEDLTIDWGSAEATKESEDDFEIISEPETAAPQSSLPPLSLFDEGVAPADTAEMGPQKIIVQLLPPPVIQQAPKSDKLPIPLYPGFRCSIFAIIKQLANPGPHSPTIKITGKVLGREVAFQVPVTPIALDGNTTTKAMESGKLLHTLAAKALIQTYEDLPSSAENKAHIERLGKRYSLASSVTSFLAIDYDSSSEFRPLPFIQVEILPTPPRRLGNGRVVVQNSISPALYMQQAPMQQMQAQPYHQLQPQATGFMPQATYGAAPGGGFGAVSMKSMASNSSPPAFAPPPPRPVVGSSMRYTDSRDDSPSMSPGIGYGSAGPDRDRGSARSRDPLVSTIQAMKTNISQVLERGERLDSLVDKTESLSQSSKSFSPARKSLSSAKGGALVGAAASHSYASPPARGRGGGPVPAPAPSSRYTSAFSFGKPGAAKKKSKVALDYDEDEGDGHPRTTGSPALPTGPLTLESIARAQQFDGSFPHDLAFLTKVCSGKPIPALPGILANVNGDANVKEVIWATVLVLACLKRTFAGEKDSWEMMAEKATVFMEDALVDMGANANVLAGLIAQAGN